MNHGKHFTRVVDGDQTVDGLAGGGGSCDGGGGGTHVDDYEIVKPIGKGKFAMVYRLAKYEEKGW